MSSAEHDCNWKVKNPHYMIYDRHYQKGGFDSKVAARVHDQQWASQYRQAAQSDYSTESVLKLSKLVPYERPGKEDHTPISNSWKDRSVEVQPFPHQQVITDGNHPSHKGHRDIFFDNEGKETVKSICDVSNRQCHRDRQN